MRKIIYLIVLAAFIQFNNVKAQAFEKGSKVLSIGMGIGGYGTRQTSTTNLSFTVSGFPYSTSQISDTTDGAASFMIPVSFEYGISNKFGIGADLTLVRYFIAEEDRDVIEKVGGGDFGLKVNYHLLNSDKNDLFIGLGLGVSSINWTYKVNPAKLNFLESAKGSGGYFSLGIADRIYFSEKIGLLLYFDYRTYKFSKLTTEVSQEAINEFESQGFSDVHFSQELDWRLKGVNLGLGITFKF